MFDWHIDWHSDGDCLENIQVPIGVIGISHHPAVLNRNENTLYYHRPLGNWSGDCSGRGDSGAVEPGAQC